MMRCQGIWKILLSGQNSVSQYYRGEEFLQIYAPKGGAIVQLWAMRQLSQALGISFLHTTAFLSMEVSKIAPHIKRMWSGVHWVGSGRHVIVPGESPRHLHGPY